MTPTQASKIKVGDYVISMTGKVFEVMESDIDYIISEPDRYMNVTDWLIIKFVCKWSMPIYNTIEELEKKYKK